MCEIASDCFAKTKIKQDNQWEIQYSKGEEYLSKGNLKRAEKAYIKSLYTANSIERSKSFLRLGETYEALKVSKDAEYCYRKSIEYKNSDAYQVFSTFLRKQGRVREAEKIENDELLANQQKISFPAEIREGENHLLKGGTVRRK